MYRLGLIGYPITHSLSPWIHQTFLNSANLSGGYDIFEIHPEQSFSAALTKLKEQNVQGFNVTIPYKQKIIDYLDDIDEEAKVIGAVNTVLLRDGKWIGYNTDGSGYIRALRHDYPELFSEHIHDQKVLLLGAGGAARGLYYALMSAGFAHIDLANRTIASATEIAKLKKDDIETNILSLAEAEQQLATYDLIIQTTSVGMNPHVDETIIPIQQLKEGVIVSDIVYQPIETKFLQQAKGLGAKIHYGHTMLLYQAQYAFEIWTGKKIDVADMVQDLELKLKG